jgi:hypothetical protein
VAQLTCQEEIARMGVCCQQDDDGIGNAVSVLGVPLMRTKD